MTASEQKIADSFERIGKFMKLNESQINDAVILSSFLMSTAMQKALERFPFEPLAGAVAVAAIIMAAEASSDACMSALRKLSAEQN